MPDLLKPKRNLYMFMHARFYMVPVLALMVFVRACTSPALSRPSVLLSPTPSSTGTAVPSQTRAQPTLAVTTQILSGHTDRVTLLAWSPDGTRLASASSSQSDLTIRLWDPQGLLLATLQGHTGPILSLAWSPSGATLASGSADQTVRFWRRDGTLLRTLEVGRGNIWAVAWAPDGSLFATGSIVQFLNPTVQVCKADGTAVWTAGTHYSGGKFYNLLWSPDGELLLGGATDYGLWNRGGTELVSVSGCEHCTPQWGAAWAPDSSEFALGDENGTLQLYDRAGKLLQGYQSSFDVNAIAWSPDGQLLAAGRDLWTSSGHHLAGANGRVNSVAWSPDGQYVAIAADMLISLIRSDGAHVAVLRGHTDQVNRVAWSPTGLTLASASDDHTIRLWHIASKP